MPEPILAPRSALAGLLQPGHRGRPGPAGVTLRDDVGFDIASVAARSGRVSALVEAVRAAFGLALPHTPRWVGDARLAFLWAGDARWMVVSTTATGGTAASLEATLRDRLGALAVVVGQGDGRVAMRVSGPSARDLLAKAVTVDLHPRAFRPGQVALTPAFGIPVQLCQRDDAPTYEIFAPRSYAANLFTWLVAAGEEYGIAVAGAENDTR